VHLPSRSVQREQRAVAAGCGLALGIDLDTIVAGLTEAPQVPGRLERVDCGQPFSVIVDLRTHSDSLEKRFGLCAM